MRYTAFLFSAIAAGFSHDHSSNGAERLSGAVIAILTKRPVERKQGELVFKHIAIN